MSPRPHASHRHPAAACRTRPGADDLSPPLSRRLGRATLPLALALLFAACSSGEGSGEASVPAGDDAVVTPAPNAGEDDDGGEEVPDTLAPGALAPLPSPPLTAPPDAGDEPLPLRRPYTTATRFAALENRPWTPPNPLEAIDEATFLAGPPEPVLHAPPGFDPSTNRPPFFPDWENVTVVAGTPLELRFAPIDPDGGVAGQYPNALPPGARYIDNFDTTRSLLWRPLEPDVGIRPFTLFTVDPVEPALRVEYTVLIRVIMPSDPSTIENRPPGIDRVPPQTVRAGDPVVLHVKGTDPNGTVPTLDIRGLPPGSTVSPLPGDPRVQVVRFRPEATGTLELEAIARDAVDPSLSARESILIDVRAPSRFTRSGARLRDLADARGFRIGYASAPNFHRRPDGALYETIASEEFNIVTAENSMKWDTLNPEPGLYRWAEADNLVAHAQASDMLVHGHTLVWYTQLPAWLKARPPATLEGHMREHIDRVLTRYAARVPVWDVVNEALDREGNLRRSIWLDAMGPGYIDTAFRQARLSAPEATLLYNEYDIGFDGPKADGLFRLLETLQAAGTPLDGVGFQLHLFADFERFDELAENVRRVAAMGLDVYITELDVSMRATDTEEAQAQVFENVASVCLAEPRCKALQSWGFTDRHSWRREQSPLMFDRDYAPKPAYFALQRRLGEN